MLNFYFQLGIVTCPWMDPMTGFLCVIARGWGFLKGGLESSGAKNVVCLWERPCMGSRPKLGAAGSKPAHKSCADERRANLCAGGAHSVGFHFTHRIVILITTRRSVERDTSLSSLQLSFSPGSSPWRPVLKALRFIFDRSLQIWTPRPWGGLTTAPHLSWYMLYFTILTPFISLHMHVCVCACMRREGAYS